jgi:pimeloyl-ACP methyl ester carboxylesterase
MRKPSHILSFLLVWLVLGTLIPAGLYATSDAGVADDVYEAAVAPRHLASSALATNDPQTLVFRRGLADYDGVTDTYIQHDSLDPRGAEQMAHIKESSYGAKRALIRFEVTEIPHYMEIMEARLELFVGYRHPEQPAPVSFHHLLKPWDEATATWHTTGLDAWSSPGAESAGSDYEATAFASTTFPTVNGYHAIDVTEAVQRWVQNPIGNYGFVIRGNSPTDVRVWASESPRENERPRLTITYRLPPGMTPEPTYTPTPTHTPPPAPSATPTPANMITSFGVADAFPPDDYYRKQWGCIRASPDSPGSMEVLLVWEGAPTSAMLSFYHANNNNRRHSVMVNDQIIGILPGDNYASACTGNASYAEISFDPSILRSGLNKITILADVPGENAWSLDAPKIHLGGAVQGSDIRVVNVASTFDSTVQPAMVQKPVGHDQIAPDVPTPLVIALPGWGGRHYDAILWFAQAASEQGWLLASSDLRGTGARTPTKAVQRDVMDLINWMIADPEYNVDPDRVYIVGSSMGGLMASVIAAKNPDRFGALAELKGPTDLSAWYYESPSRQELIARDCGNYPPSAQPFCYQRMSVSSMPMNLGNMPTLIVHGTEDTVVPFHHATQFRDGLNHYRDVFYGDGAGTVTVQEYPGEHTVDHPDWEPADILSFFAPHVVVRDPMTVTVRTDEPKRYYWLDIAYGTAAGDHWTQVNAWRDPLGRFVTVEARDESNRPIDVALNLAAIGLAGHPSYTIAEQNLTTGGFQQYTLSASGDWLTLPVPSDHRRLVVHPHDVPQPQTVTLSQGESGYAGVTDAYIDAYVPTVNHANDALRLTNGSNRASLLRFELQGLSQLPPNAGIRSAQLRLYAAQKWDPSHNLSVALYPLLTTWDVNAVNWFNATAGSLWSEPGAMASGEDFSPRRYGPMTLNNVPQWITINVTELVQEWMADPSSNHGVILRAESGTGTFIVSSSESHANRPELIVVWAEATPTPTASLTPTATLTQVATSTPTPTGNGSTATPTWTSTPTVTVTPSPQSGRLHLPLILYRTYRGT